MRGFSYETHCFHLLGNNNVQFCLHRYVGAGSPPVSQRPKPPAMQPLCSLTSPCTNSRRTAVFLQICRTFLFLSEHATILWTSGLTRFIYEMIAARFAIVLSRRDGSTAARTIPSPVQPGTPSNLKPCVAPRPSRIPCLSKRSRSCHRGLLIRGSSAGHLSRNRTVTDIRASSVPISAD